MTVLAGVMRIVAFVLISAFIIGGLTFAIRVTVSQPPQMSADNAQGVVALTGGGGARIKEAMRLLGSGRAERLLISGVNPQTPSADIRAMANGDEQLFDCCVDFGRSATSTRENALEIAAWARENGYTSIIVVTSDFHMPRSLIEIRAQSPGVTFSAHPIPGSKQGGHWWRDPKAIRRLSVEYVKFLVVLASPPRPALVAEAAQ